jgi:transposase-like protein
VYPEKVRQQAVTMYCEGNGVEVISRVLEVKTGTNYSWIKKRGSMPEGDGDSSQASSEPSA